MCSVCNACSVCIVCMYVVIDQKVLVRSFNCESRARFESVFFEFAKVTFFFAKVSRKLDIIIIM